MHSHMMVDHPAPDFALPATGNQTFSLSQARGENLVLFFYPKDNTPGCNNEAGEFRGVKAPGHAAEVLEFVNTLKRTR